jgi:hypothetical protein
MSFCVHALGVCDVVTALRFVAGDLTRAQADEPTRRAAHTGSDCGAMTAADGAADERSNHRACDTASNSGILLRTRRSLAAYRFIRVLPARSFVVTELIERLTCSRQRHGARACGN